MSPLQRLIELVPPPARPHGMRGDRGAARRELGWDVQDHVFEVVETYGSVSFMGWLLQPSPFDAGDVAILRDRGAALERRQPGARSVLAFSDPARAWLFVGEDGSISVSDGRKTTSSGRSLPEFLVAWLGGEETFGLLSVQDLTETEDIPPFAVPLWDASRPSRIAWMYVKGGAATRAERWAALRAALGPHTVCARIGDGERRQDRVYEGELEADVFYDSYNRRDDVEQIHLRFYDDRASEVKARFEAMLAAAGMTLVQMQSPRGPATW